MPQPQSSHTYDVTIDGVQYEVTSDRELTDAQAYRFAKQQASQPQVEYQPGELASHMTGQAPSTVSDTPAHEPDTYWGGFWKSLSDQAGSARTNLIEAMRGPAHPQTPGDLAPLLIPSGIEGVVSKAGRNVLAGMTSTAGRATEAAGTALPATGTALVGSLMGGPKGAAIGAAVPKVLQTAGRGMQRASRILKPVESAIMEPHAPNVSGYIPNQVLDAGAGHIENVVLSPSTPMPILRKASGPAPTLEQNFGSTLEDLLRKDTAPTGTLPPEPGITPAGREGAFYSSGRPGVTEARYGEIVPDVIPEPTGDPSFAPVGDETSFNAPRQPGAAPGPGAMSPDDVTHQALLDKLGGTASPGLIEPPFVPRDPEPSMADIALSDAREHWGSKNVPGATEPEVRASTPLMERDQPRDLSAEPATRIGANYLDRMSPAQMIEWYNKIADTGPFKTEAARQIRARGVSLP